MSTSTRPLGVKHSRLRAARVDMAWQDSLSDLVSDIEAYLSAFDIEIFYNGVTGMTASSPLLRPLSQGCDLNMSITARCGRKRRNIR